MKLIYQTRLYNIIANSVVDLIDKGVVDLVSKDAVLATEADDEEEDDECQVEDNLANRQNEEESMSF